MKRSTAIGHLLRLGEVATGAAGKSFGDPFSVREMWAAQMRDEFVVGRLLVSCPVGWLGYRAS